MESKDIVCSEHNGINLFASIFFVVGIILIIFLAKKSPPVKKVDQIAFVIILMIIIGGAIGCFMLYMNKKLILRGNEVLCINGFGQEKIYTLNRIKKVKIDDSLRFCHIKITFDDGYSYTVNGSATNYSEFESIAKKEWQKLH